MVIKAKFSSRCAACGGQIHVSDAVEWSRGTPAVHVHCPAEQTKTPKDKATKNLAPKVSNIDTTGCIFARRPSKGRDDNYEIGQVVHAPRVPGGGGDDLHYFVVVTVERKWRDDDSVGDTWMCGCYMRPARAEECTDKIADRKKQEARSALNAELNNLLRDSKIETAEKIPESAKEIAGSHILYVTEDAVWERTSSDDDILRTWVSRDPRVVEIMKLLEE